MVLASTWLARPKNNFLRPVCHPLAPAAHKLPDRFHNLNVLAAESRLGTPNPDVCYVDRISGQRRKSHRLTNDSAASRIARAINL
jgi:hypothetical protein